MNSTNITILINAADQVAAQKDFPDYFNTGASATGEAPATHFFTQGYFSNTEVDKISGNKDPITGARISWDSMIRCPDWQVALAGEGLQMIVETPDVAG